MSIELLPPDEKYPNIYHVRSNYCNCHPETCSCNDWAVYTPDGEKHSTYFREETADAVADGLNNREALAKTIDFLKGDLKVIEAHAEALQGIISELHQTIENKNAIINRLIYLTERALEKHEKPNDCFPGPAIKGCDGIDARCPVCHVLEFISTLEK